MSDVTQAKFQTLYARFSQHLRQHGADDRAYGLYRTHVRGALRSLPARDALTLIVRLEMQLPQTENALCGAMRLDEGLFDMKAGHLPHALTALKDSCSISAKCRDKAGMVEGAIALAQCFHLMRDDESAKRSAALCVRAIETHFDQKHPLYAQAKTYANGDFSDLHKAERTPSAPEAAPQDLPPSFIRPGEYAKIDPTLQQSSFVDVGTYDAPLEESLPTDDDDTLFEQDDFVDDGSLERASFAPVEEELRLQEEITEEPAQAETETRPPIAQEEAPVLQEEPVQQQVQQPQSQKEPIAQEVLQLAPADGSIYLEDQQMVVGFSKKSERITGSSQRRRDVQTSILVGAQNGLLLQETALDAAMQQQIETWTQQGRFDEGLNFLGALQEALPKDSSYQPQVSVWTAQMLADAGDPQRAVGLYSRIVEQMLQNGSANDALGMSAMQQLCDLYHQLEEYQRELALRKLVFRMMNQNHAPAEAVLVAGEDFIQALLEAKQMQDLDVMCRWYAAQSGDPQLFAECVDVLLPFYDAQENDEAVCGLCAMAKDYCTRQQWPMQENWIAAWMLANINLGDASALAKLAMAFEQELCTDAMQDTVTVILQCADEFAGAEAFEQAADFYSICLNVYMTRGEAEQEKETALKLADALEACGRTMEASDIRNIYEPSAKEAAKEAAEEAAQDVVEKDAEETAQEPAQEPEEEAPLRAEDLRARAEACEKEGDSERAMFYRGKLYRLKKEELGQNHPDTLAALNNYAKALSAAGNLKDAVLHQLSAVQGYADTMGQNHAYTLTAMNNLARTMERAGQFTEAYAVHQTIYQIYSDMLPSDHALVQRARKRMLRAKKLTTKI